MNDIVTRDIETRARCLTTDAYELAIAIRKNGVSEHTVMGLWSALSLLLSILLTGERNED